jgi:hypothetical protein
MTVPVAPSAAEPPAIEPGETLGVARPLPLHEKRILVFAGTMSLIATAVIVPAVEFVPVMRYAMHWPGAVPGPAARAAVV